MKRTTLILTLCLFTISLSGNTIMNQLFTSVYNTVKHDLNIDSVTIMIYDSKFNPHVNKGAITYSNENEFIIYIDSNLPKWDVISIMIHELVHVSQVHTGRMKIFTGCVYFEGNQYLNRPDAPYEIEAMILTDSLYRKYRKEFKSL